METFNIYTKEKDQARTVKAFLKALGIPYESSAESPYDPEFVAKIKEGKLTAEGDIFSVFLLSRGTR